MNDALGQRSTPGSCSRKPSPSHRLGRCKDRKDPEPQRKKTPEVTVIEAFARLSGNRGGSPEPRLTFELKATSWQSTAILQLAISLRGPDKPSLLRPTAKSVGLKEAKPPRVGQDRTIPLKSPMDFHRNPP